MKNGTCPRCNSRDVYHEAGHALQEEKITLKPGLFGGTSAPDRYVCTACGYVELYISSAGDLQSIRDSWERVTK